MTANRYAQCVVAGIVASAFVGWFSGCGSDADGQFREYSQLEPASAVVEADGTGKTPDSQDNPRNVALASTTTNGQVNTLNNAQASVLSQPPIEAPLPSFTDSDNGSSGKPNGSEPPTLVGTSDPPTLVPDRRKPIVDRGTRNPRGNVGKTLPPVVPRQVKLLVKERKFKVEGPEKAIRISYDDIDLLKVLNMEPVTADAPKLMPVWLKGLDGRRIRIRGFMFNSFQETGIPAFLMGRDNQICCFGGYAKIYDLFPVILRKGVTTDYIQNRPFDVVGVFHIETIVDEGELYQLYRIDDAVVIDK
jgi:hypothetical protein